VTDQRLRDTLLTEMTEPNTKAGVAGVETEAAMPARVPGQPAVPQRNARGRSSPWTRLAGVAVLAAAMAHVEGVLVYYLSRFVPGIPGRYDHGFLFPAHYMTVERSRELATMVMLLAIGFLAGRTWWQKAAYYLFAFGCWDICYYVSLRVLLHWPQSLTGRDLLFLIPGQWWGPVWEPLTFSIVFMTAAVIILRVARRA
jgi:hypothetical protein